MIAIPIFLVPAIFYGPKEYLFSSRNLKNFKFNVLFTENIQKMSSNLVPTFPICQWGKNSLKYLIFNCVKAMCRMKKTEKTRHL